MKAALLYSGLRLALLIAVGGLAYLVGMRGILLLIVAFLVSGVLSYFWLSGPRSQFGSSVGGYFRGLNDRIDQAAAAEDDPDDEIRLPNTSEAPRTADSPRSS